MKSEEHDILTANLRSEEAKSKMMTDMPEPPIFIDGSETDPKEIYVFSDGMDKSISLLPNKYFVQYTRTDTIPQVKVKPLDWYDYGAPDFPNSSGSVAEQTKYYYRITHCYGVWEIVGDLSGIYSDIESAKAAAQAHYDAAILSAIEGEG